MLQLSFTSSLHLFYFYLTILLYIYTSLSLLTSLCLLLFPSQSSSNTVITYTYLLLSSFILLLSGYLQPFSNLSYPLRVLSHLSFGRYAFQTLMILCYGDTRSGKWYLERYSFYDASDDTIAHCIFSLFLWFAVLQLGIIWGLYPFQSRVLYSQALGYFGADSLPRRSGGGSSTPVGSRGDDDLESNPRTAHRLLQNDHSLTSDQHLIDTTYHTPASPSALAINQPSYPSGFQPVLHSVTIVPLDPAKRTSLQFHNINFYLKTSAASSSSSSFYFSSSPSSATSQSLSLIIQSLPSFPRWNPPPPPTDVATDPHYELLLRNLSGECAPNQLWCLLDSEDDTTTLTVLLQLLSGISKPYGIATGQMTINGAVEMTQDTQQPFENLVYVCKGDSPNHRYLTVREVLYYQILLRRRTQKSCEGFIRWAEMCWRTPQRKVEERSRGDDPYLLEELSIHEQVNSIIQLFQLEEIGEIPLLVGDSSNPHISPSQLRCLTIAMESIHSPGIYLLQDPFEGLDWYHTERVLRVLRGLVDGGRCVICAISNPTERMLCYFNRLMLLHKGLLLYSGEMSQVKPHFDSIGYQALPQQSLLDYLYDICHGRAMLTSLAPPSQQQQQHHLSPEGGSGSRKRASSSLLTPEDLANIRHSMDGYTSTPTRNTLSSRRSHSSSVGANPVDHSERLTSSSTDIPFQFVIEDFPSGGGAEGGGELEDIPMPFGPVVGRSVPLVLPSARVTLYRRCVSAFRNVSHPPPPPLSSPSSFLSGE
jgi:ABC-type multidrug transport system ATPase subunit